MHSHRPRTGRARTARGQRGAPAGDTGTWRRAGAKRTRGEAAPPLSRARHSSPVPEYSSESGPPQSTVIQAHHQAPPSWPATQHCQLLIHGVEKLWKEEMEGGLPALPFPLFPPPSSVPPPALSLPPSLSSLHLATSAFALSLPAPPPPSPSLSHTSPGHSRPRRVRMLVRVTWRGNVRERERERER